MDKLEVGDYDCKFDTHEGVKCDCGSYLRLFSKELSKYFRLFFSFIKQIGKNVPCSVVWGFICQYSRKINSN